MRLPRNNPAAWLLLALATVWAPAGEARPPAGPASGQYDSLFLTIRDGEVRGVFSDARAGNGTGDAPQFSCRFQLRGRLDGGRGVVTTWYPGGSTVVGNLSFEGGGVSLLLRDNQDGCLMATGDMTREPYRARLARPGGDWIGVTLVTAAHAVLHPAPEASSRRTPYVVDGDAVAVLERRAGWARVRYLGGEKPSTGWVHATELAPETPPAAQ